MRSEFIFRDRFNLSSADYKLVAEDGLDAVGPPAPGGPFALAWRSYLKSVFKRGFMYKLSCSPSVVLYIVENKTLAGKEDRTYEGEALGRKLVVSFMEHTGNLVQRVDRESLVLKQQLLSLAELLQTVGGVALPVDPERTAAATELLLEAECQSLEIQRFVCTLETAAPGVHMYTLDDEYNGETAMALECSPDHRTKMVLSRCLQRNDELLDGETVQSAWSLSLAQLQARTAPLLPALPLATEPKAPAAPVAPPAKQGRSGRGRGRGRGKVMSTSGAL